MDLLSSVSPMAAILLNIEMSLTCANLSEEGYTLSKTLLPYLNVCNNFSFIKEESTYIVTRFMNSLT
jgi:hypothetical protein